MIYVDDTGFRTVRTGRVLMVFGAVVFWAAVITLFLTQDALSLAGLPPAMVGLILGIALFQSGTSEQHRVLPARCPKCDEANAPGATLCGRCGAPIPPRDA